MNPSPRLWILKSKGSESAFGGNNGYADQPDAHYIYDTTVKNHDKIQQGDYIIIVNKLYLIGIAQITSIIVEKNLPKKRYRCPVCNTQEHYSRQSLSPKYKCRNKHEFEYPIEQDIIVDQFVAHYSTTFKASPPKTSVKILDNYYIKRNLYYSIQQADPFFLQIQFASLYEGQQKINFEHDSFPIDTIPAYIPTESDHRKFGISRNPTRQGQNKFRNDLIRIYGPKCMLTGCETISVIEASHICPYKGRKDHNQHNGLLLKKDLHTLFDLNLIGIDPESLTVELHPSIKNSYFKEYEGKKLILSRSDFQPSKKALQYRWNIFKGLNHSLYKS